MGKQLHPDPSSAAKSLEQQSGVPVGKVPGGESTPWVRLQIVFLGASVDNPRLQTDIISLHAKMQLWFNINNAVDFTMRVTRFSRPWGTGQVPRAQEIPRPTPFLVVHAA